MVCDTHICRARPAPHHAGLSPWRPCSGPHASGLGGVRAHPQHAAAHGTAARS